MDRAVPAMIFAAASMSSALRSFIFFSAIALSWSWVIFATLSRLGSAEPFSSDSACLISTAAGGLLVTNVNERSSYTVITTGITVPASDCVWAFERLDELHDVDAVLTQRRPHGRRRARLTAN